MGALALGVFIFSTQDAIIKSISGDYAVTEAIALRSLVSLPILAAMAWREAGLSALFAGDIRPLLARGLILFVCYTAYYMAFPALPLAEAIALYFLAPTFVSVFAGPILGERVGAATWAALAVGFVGVLFILRPGQGLFEPAALLSLFSAATYALAMVLARKYGANAPASVMAFHQNAVYGIGALTIAGASRAQGIGRLANPSLDFLLRPWSMPPTRDLLLMASCGIIAAVAMSLLTQAYRIAEANRVSVIEYTGMIWAPLWGYLFFAETPRWTTLVGMALIVGAGVAAAQAARRTS